MQSFRGTPLEQATCLLRRVEIGAKLTSQPLPTNLESRVGRAFTATPAQIISALDALPATQRSHFRQHLGSPLARTEGNLPTQYFVIHDTSTPYLRDRPFPLELDSNASINRLSGYLGSNAKAHYFVNRQGQIGIGHEFSTPWRATKLELKVAGEPSRGRFIHIELRNPGAETQRLAGLKTTGFRRIPASATNSIKYFRHSTSLLATGPAGG